VSTVLTVALLQIDAAGYDRHENLRRGEAACRRAAVLGADIALFPEMWSIGYRFEGGEAASLEAGGVAQPAAALVAGDELPVAEPCRRRDAAGRPFAP
jgi:predicted amidohydrolase